MKITKAFIFAAIVVLLCLFTISCSPDTQNRLSPTNTFDVNMSVLSGYNYSDTIKTIVVDGDSIKFNLVNSENLAGPFGTTLTLSVNAPNYAVLRAKTYPYNYFTNNIDSTYPTGNIDVINGEVLINDFYTTNTWDSLYYLSPDMANTYGLPEYSGKYITLTWLNLHTDIDGTPWIRYDMPKNIDQYIVLRKHINTQYQYYWIRTRNEIAYSSDSSTYTQTIKILNGKYQMNSITTGQ